MEHYISHSPSSPWVRGAARSNNSLLGKVMVCTSLSQPRMGSGVSDRPFIQYELIYLYINFKWHYSKWKLIYELNLILWCIPTQWSSCSIISSNYLSVPHLISRMYVQYTNPPRLSLIHLIESAKLIKVNTYLYRCNIYL